MTQTVSHVLKSLLISQLLEKNKTVSIPKKRGKSNISRTNVTNTHGETSSVHKTSSSNVDFTLLEQRVDRNCWALIAQRQHNIV